MLKTFLLLLVLQVAARVSFAQNSPARTPEELSSLLANSRRDTGRVSLLLDLSFSYILLPGARPGDMSKALTYTNQALDLSRALREPRWEGRTNTAFSAIFREQGHKETGEAFARAAIEILETCNCKAELAEAYIEKSNYYDPYSDTEGPEKIRLCELATALFEQTHQTLRQASVLQNLADFYQIKGDMDHSMADLLQALRLYQSIGYRQLQGVYDLLGTVSEQQDNLQQAMKYGLLAVQTAEAQKDTTQQLCAIYNRLGLTYYRLKQLANAAVYFDKALSVAMRLRDTVSIMTVVPNIVNTQLLLHEPAKALAYLKSAEPMFVQEALYDRVLLASCFANTYLMLKKPERAYPYVQRLLVLYQQPLSPAAIKSLLPPVFGYLYATRQYTVMYKYLDDYEALNKQYPSLGNLAALYKWRFQVDSALGKYQEAITYYQTYVTLKDSLLTIQNNKQIARMQLEFETEKKDNDLQMLTQQSELQIKELDRSNLIKNVTFGGLGLLLVIVGLLYNRYRLKQRSNKRLEQQQIEIHEKNVSLQHLLDEKEWLMKEIHHRVKNNLQIAISLLNSQTAYLENDAAAQAIRDSQHRMRAMALIHQKLYQTDRITLIDMDSYIRDLLDYLDDNFNASQHIHFELQTGEVELEVNQAVPVGLILNEAITNAIKYAFPGNEKGSVTISMRHAGPERVVLRIADDGRGLPEKFAAQEHDSFGINLMQGLARQLNGTFRMDGSDGVSVLIEFPVEKTMPMASRPGVSVQLSQAAAS